MGMGIKNHIKRWSANVLGGDWSQNYPLPYLIPVYHAVSDVDLPHLKHIIRYKNSQEFESDLDEMSKYVEWLDWSQFKSVLNRTYKGNKLPALLTFDDGLSDFYDTVAPILERKGIYAINFINPKFIDNHDLMFRCKASLLISELENELEPSIEQHDILNVKFQKPEQLDVWAKQLNVDFDDYLTESSPYLTTDQLLNLKKRGFGIGAHGWDHPLYCDLSLQDQLQNTAKAVQYCHEMGFESDVFAFPFTDDRVGSDFFKALQKDDVPFYTMGCAGIKRDSVITNIQRVPMEYGLSADKMLQEEVAYYKLKSLMNKNLIKR